MSPDESSARPPIPQRLLAILGGLAAILILVVGTLAMLLGQLDLAGLDLAIAIGLGLGWVLYLGFTSALLWRYAKPSPVQAAYFELTGGLLSLASLMDFIRTAPQVRPFADLYSLWILTFCLLAHGTYGWFRSRQSSG